MTTELPTEAECDEALEMLGMLLWTIILDPSPGRATDLAKTTSAIMELTKLKNSLN